MNEVIFVRFNLKRFFQRLTEWFKVWKDDQPVLCIDGNTLNKVKVTVTLRVVHRIKPVKSEDLDQLPVAYNLSFLQLWIINPGAVITVDYSQLKVLS